MPRPLKEKLKRIPGLQTLARRFGLASQGSWLFRRDVLGWTAEPAVVEQLPLTYRAFAGYASAFFSRSKRRRLPAGRIAFQAASVAHRLAKRGKTLARLRVEGLEVVVDLQDPRFLQVVNELSRRVDTAFLAEFVKAGDTFIDVGANHGAFALVASRLVGPSGHVVAVEPQPRLAEAVEQSLSATAPGSFEVHALALGDRDGTVDLFVPRSYSGTAGVFAAHSGTHPHRRVSVPLRRFDDEVTWRQFPGSVFVKLDVEGSEYAFLRGAAEMIRARRPVLLMEFNRGALDASATSEELLTSLLQDLGYTDYAELDAPAVRRPLRDIATAAQGTRNVLVFTAQAADGS